MSVARIFSSYMWPSSSRIDARSDADENDVPLFFLELTAAGKMTNVLLLFMGWPI